MRRFLPIGWLGTYLLFPVLTTGCQHNRSCCANCTATPAATMAAPVAMPANTVATADAAASKAMPPPNNPPALAQPSPTTARDLPMPAQAATTAGRPRFDHDANYHWLVGTLDYSRIQQGWLLRYVPIEQDDRYGGCVTLVASSQESHFKRGQTVRVEGELIDPESHQLRPAYQVKNIRVEEP